nr:hypothetical protein [Tanacetum cinerariifolium]
EVGVAVVASPAKVLELDTYSSLESGPSKVAPPGFVDDELFLSDLDRTFLSVDFTAHIMTGHAFFTIITPGHEPRLWLRSHVLSTHFSSNAESSPSDSPATTSDRYSYSSSHSTGPSRKRCMSPATTVSSSILALGALVPTRTNLLPPHKRFRDSYSSEDDVEEDINADVLADIKADVVAVEDDIEDEDDGEAKPSDRGTIEVGVDMVARIDIPDGMLLPDAIEHLELVEENGDDGDNENGGGNRDGNGEGNGNINGGGNRNGNPNRNNKGAMPVTQEDRVEKFIGGLPNNIQKNVIAPEPTRLWDAIRIANNLMDQKLKVYVAKSMENKKGLNFNQKYNHTQQPLIRDKMLVDRMWQEPTRLVIMKERDMLDLGLTATSVSYIMRGGVL